MSMQAPRSSHLNLLSLPIELRLQILYHALLPSPPSYGPTSDMTLIDVDTREVHKECVTNFPNKYYWGTSRMTPPLLINRQLHLEAEEVL